MVESKRFFLRINPLYRELMLRAQQEEAHLNDDERKHIQQYVSRARLFMANIDQRRQTLQRIVAYLVSFQGDYLANGVRHLRPLTRAMVAPSWACTSPPSPAPRRPSTSCCPRARWCP